MSERCALSDEILLRIEKPARYIGREVNAVVKDPGSVSIRYAMCFPDVYEIGMSHLGIQIIYEQLNQREDTWCERVYSPWPDLHKIMKEEGIPLFALESQDPVRCFDFLGITLQYELCYTNILQVLDLAGIPLHASDRGEEDPIVMAGGPCATNPEPVAPFFDLFYIGESETVMDELLDRYREIRERGLSRRDFLYTAAHIPGIYVPSLYEAAYSPDGTIASFTPTDGSLPKMIRRQVMPDLADTPYPEKPLVPFVRPVQDRITLEIQRGCARGCRFCQAGMIYRPVRRRTLSFLEKTARAMAESTGYDEMTLSSLSSSDYPQLQELLTDLMDYCGEARININLPSLRIDRFSLDIMQKIQDVRKSSLTFAPEAGSQRLRNVINKGLSEEEILWGAEEAFRGGWSQIKLYFMLGQPTETVEDREDIAALCQKVADTFNAIPKEERARRLGITASSSFFVAKPFTPFQWTAMFRPEDYRAFAKTVMDAMRRQPSFKSIRYNWHDPEVTVIEGVLARGDRRIAPVIEEVYRSGGIFDAWTDFFSMDRWDAAFAKCGIDPAFYTARERDKEEILPWDFIDAGVSRTFLWKEYEKALSGAVTENCFDKCSGCGAMSYGCGICVEERAVKEVRR